MNDSLSSNESRGIVKLILPSWLSGLITIVISIGVTIAVIAVFSLQNSTVQQQLLVWQYNKPQQALTTPDQTLPDNKVTIGNSWPLMVIWGSVGLVVYLIAISFVNNIRRAKQITDTLNYVNADRHIIIRSAVERLIIRCLASVILILTLYLTVKKIAPYALTAALASAGDLKSLSGLLDALLSIIVLSSTIHLLVILMRLSVGRTRLLLR